MNDLQIARSFSLASDEAWRLWTDPQLLAKWWWPGRFNTTYEVDLHTGGRYRFLTAETEPFGVLDLNGTFTEVLPVERLAYSWRWDEGHESDVSVRFESQGETGTTVTVAHEGLENAEDVKNHIQGWNDCLDRLEQLTEGQLQEAG